MVALFWYIFLLFTPIDLFIQLEMSQLIGSLAYKDAN